MVLISAFFLVFTAAVWAQSWVVDVNEHWDIEYSMIPRESWERILKANETVSKSVVLEYQDNYGFDGSSGAKVSRGTKPEYSGYYFLVGRSIAKSAEARQMSANTSLILVFGHSQTGAVLLSFFNDPKIPGSIDIQKNYDEYEAKRDRLLELVGEW